MKKSLLLLAASLMPTLLCAQELKSGYITWPSSSSLGDYVSQWNGGNGKIQINGANWDDAEFFISHVRPRQRFQNTNTQINPGRVPFDASSTTQSALTTDKRLAYWVCVSDQARNGVNTNALANGVFDQEVFNMWSYVDNYGNWDSPFGFTPGVWTDICHKNGVSTHGVAGIPNASISSEWSNALTKLTDLGAEKVGKFLRYFGQNGLGYNSEFSSGSTVMSKLMPFHNGLRDYMADKDPLWEIMWYNATNDYGSIEWDNGLDNKTGIFAGASAFQNYNWNKTSYINSAITKAKAMNKSPMYIYAGMNMQGGEPVGTSSDPNFGLLKDYQYSIGFWAGHNNNILWKNRQHDGSSLEAKQRTYIHDNEMWFGNGKRNPAIQQTLTNITAYQPSESFAGMSAMMNARSTINHTVKTEPFITYFNLGNGLFFNWKGERANNNQWYNIGIQDFLPTWRYWFAPAWRQTSVTEGTTHLSADFTWEDAYMGGSCLKITGTTDTEYLHLFKTNIAIAGDQQITVRYKLTGGEADVRLVVTSTSKPQTEASEKSGWRGLTLCTVATSLDDQDQSYKKGADGWIEKTFEIKSSMVGSLALKDIGLIGLEFKNAKNMELLLGELSIAPKANLATPAQPEIVSSKVLGYNIKGADGKLVWKMANSKAVGEPVYNDEVNTSLFKIYSQQKGEAETLLAATTSWAGFAFQAPVNSKGESKIRFGVSAVSMDHRSESPITWTDYMELPNYVKSVDIVTDKAVIKPGEEFTMSFVDEQMAAGTWTLKNSTDNSVVWTATGKSVTCPGLSAVGAYDLELTYDESRAETTVTYPRYISITPVSVGALPDIYTISIDGQPVNENSADIVVKLNDTKKFAYEGRYADGLSSRGISLDENWFGVGNDQVQIQANQSFSVAAWIRIDEIPDDSNFLTIEDTWGSWPLNRWGFFWSRINSEGKFLRDRIDGAWGTRCGTGTECERTWYNYYDAKVDIGKWCHVAIVFEYSGSNMRMHLYINGKKQMVSQYLYANKGTVENTAGYGDAGEWSDLSNAARYGTFGTNTYDPPYFARNSYNVSSSMRISFGGSFPDGSAMKGVLDDFQVWGKAMTADDVKTSMNGLDKNNLPSDILGYWDFENDAASDNGFVGYSSSSSRAASSPKAYMYTDASKTTYLKATGDVGSPFLEGTSYPVVTAPTWETRALVSNATGTGESGSADITFHRKGDYDVTLTLANGHGAKSMEFPVVMVDPEPTAIDGIEADGEGDVKTFTVDGTLFLDFADDGDYRIEVYNAAGLLGAAKDLTAVAGQTATISLGAKGVYLVKVVKNGQALRTVKVLNK